MTTQTEAELEENLIIQPSGFGYQLITYQR
jgi:hypothetical protein